MINKDLYMMKVATYLPVLEPSWSKDPKVLEEHKLNFNPEIGKDIQYEDEDPYFMNRVLRNEFAYAGEESGVPAYVSDMPGYKKPPDFPDIDVNKPDWAFRLTAGGLGLTAAGALAAQIPNKKVSDIGVKAAIGGMGMLGAAMLSKKFPSSDTRKFDAYDKQYHAAINNNDALQKQLDPIQDAYKADFQKRYDQTVTPKVFSNLNTLRIKAMNGDTLADKKYRKELQKFRKSIKPYVRKYEPGYWENQKTAALAEELNPVPKPKRKRSVFQKFGDTLSTNKVKHIVGVAGGISGMLTGKELLHSNLTPMRALGGVGVVGGATLGAKNIYGLYNDYFD